MARVITGGNASRQTCMRAQKVECSQELQNVGFTGLGFVAARDLSCGFFCKPTEAKHDDLVDKSPEHALAQLPTSFRQAAPSFLPASYQLLMQDTLSCFLSVSHPTSHQLLMQLPISFPCSIHSASHAAGNQLLTQFPMQLPINMGRIHSDYHAASAQLLTCCGLLHELRWGMNSGYSFSTRLIHLGRQQHFRSGFKFGVNWFKRNMAAVKKQLANSNLD